MQEEGRIGLILVGMIISGSIFGFFWIHAPETPTGGAITHTAQGGRVTELNISPRAYNWKVIIGNLTNRTGLSENTSAPTIDFNTLLSTDIIEISLPLVNCSGGEIYATTQPVDYALPTLEYMQNIVPATAAMVNTYLGIASHNLQSALKVFNESANFSIGGINRSFIAALLPGKNGSQWNFGVSRITGTLNLIYVGNILPDGNSFNWSPTFFQMMLPVPEGGNVTYYFFQDKNDSCNMTQEAPAPPPPTPTPTTAQEGGGVGRITPAKNVSRPPEIPQIPSYTIPARRVSPAFGQPLNISEPDGLAIAEGLEIGRAVSGAYGVKIGVIGRFDSILRELGLGLSLFTFVIMSALLLFEIANKRR